jgi:hypothetical protein
MLGFGCQVSGFREKAVTTKNNMDIEGLHISRDETGEIIHFRQRRDSYLNKIGYMFQCSGFNS